MNRLRAGVDRALEISLVGLMTLMVVNVLWQVFTRFVLSHPSSFTEELARFLLIWVGLLGSCFALRRRLHLAIDLVVQRLAAPRRRLAGLLALAAVAAFAIGVLILGGGHLVRLTWQLGQRSAALSLPLGLVYLALPLAGALTLFYTAVEAHRLLTAQADEAGDRP